MTYRERVACLVSLARDTLAIQFHAWFIQGVQQEMPQGFMHTAPWLLNAGAAHCHSGTEASISSAPTARFVAPALLVGTIILRGWQVQLPLPPDVLPLMPCSTCSMQSTQHCAPWLLRQCSPPAAGLVVLLFQGFSTPPPPHPKPPGSYTPHPPSRPPALQHHVCRLPSCLVQCQDVS
jgi:hypothetical protein